MAIKHGETSITVEGVTEDDDVEFMQAMDFGDGRTMHVRVNSDDEDGKVEEVVIVKTDIDAPTATPFEEVNGQELDARDLDETMDGDDMDGTDTNDYTALNVAAGINNVNLPKIMSAEFTSGTGAVLTFTEDDDSTADMDEADEVAGTYNGAMGTYRCDGNTACSVTLDAKGAITAISDGWIFTPDPGADSYVADAEYLHYGFWLMRTTDADGATTYNEVETFAEATGIPATGNAGLSDVEGSATYEGGSVGVYVKNVLDNQGGIVSATSGHFSADVELTANFGGNVLPNDQFTIGGEITGFVLQHGEENDWAVGLGLADFSGRADENDPGESVPGSDFAGTFNGVATGDSTALPGTWNGAFHGSSTSVDHDMDDGTDNINPQPVAVVGEFNANFTDGTAAGGFGVNKKH